MGLSDSRSGCCRQREWSCICAPGDCCRPHEVSDVRRFYEGPVAASRRSAPAALRNREPITEVLGEWLPPSGTVLEIASGTGEHAVYFAEHFPNLEWQPTDIH